MDELIELRERIENQDYQAALEIVDELEEMSKEDKLNKIHSYLVILMLHLIKQAAENRTTKSWDRSILNSTSRINRVNKRRKAGGYYADALTLKALIAEAYPEALREASYEAFEGACTPEEIETKIDPKEIHALAAMRIEN